MMLDRGFVKIMLQAGKLSIEVGGHAARSFFQSDAYIKSDDCDVHGYGENIPVIAFHGTDFISREIAGSSQHEHL